ncbi:MAG TPA: right-handed parallel beta-helix repeat-containing protein, partial [Nakamurella sp.]
MVALPAVAALALHAAPAQAATLVVSSTGHGTQADCTSSATAFPTIAAAYAAAAAGDTIFVCPGTYTEQLTIAEAITLQGAQAGVDARGRSGPETILDAPNGDLLITAQGVTVDGFTFQGQTNTATQAGAVTAVAGDTTIVNDIFRGNIGTSVAVDGSAGSGTAAGIVISRNVADSGLSLEAASNVVVSGNQVTKPVAPGNGLRLLGADQNIVVTGNWFVGGTNGVLVQKGPSTPNSGVTVTGNCIAANSRSGLTVAAGSSAGPVQASANWWGSVNGPSGTGPGWGDAWIDPDAVISAGAFLTRPLAAPCPQLPSVSIASPPAIRRDRSGMSTLAFTIHLSAPYYTRTQVQWSTVAGTAKPGADFVTAEGTVVIPAGTTTSTVTVQIVGGTASRGTRHFTVVLSAPVNATVAAGTATATIRDRKPLPATGPGPTTVVPVGGVATGGGAGRSSAGRTVLWGGLALLGIAITLLALAARLRGASSRRVVPVAGTGCMAVIAAAALLIAGGRGVTAPAQAVPSPTPSVYGAGRAPSSL